MAADSTLRIEHVGADGAVTVLKESIPVLAGEVVDSTVMDVAELRSFLAEQMADARDQGVLFSLHLKATMMKVSDPIMFGHAVEVFFADVFAGYGDVIAAAGGDANDGWASVLDAIATLPAAQREAIEAEIARGLRARARSRDGGLRPGHHEPPRAERCHRRRIDARHDPYVGPDVERRR